MIHKKGRSLKKFDGNGKSKKKSRVVVEVSFLHKLALSNSQDFFRFCYFSYILLYMSVRLSKKMILGKASKA